MNAPLGRTIIAAVLLLMLTLTVQPTTAAVSCAVHEAKEDCGKTTCLAGHNYRMHTRHPEPSALQGMWAYNKSSVRRSPAVGSRMSLVPGVTNRKRSLLSHTSLRVGRAKVC